MAIAKELFLVFVLIISLIKKIDPYTCNYYDHPYHVQLDNLCGASLLTRKYVLTSALCCEGKKTIKIRSGYVNNKKFNQERESEAIYIHPNFTIQSIALFSPYDYCLIKMSDAMIMNKYTKQIALAKTEDLKLLKVLEKLNVTVMGHRHNVFNTENEKTDDYQESYQCATVLLATKQECENIAKPARIIFDPKTELCFTSSKISVGDTGSPVIYNGLQVGIVSSQLNRSTTFLARVDSVFSWIDELKTADSAGDTVHINKYYFFVMSVISYNIIL